ncbi:MAG: DIP1984 family protein [Clostridia bacterium]|nr:DIP1984 family protein [Clostridia bacterium]
MKLANALMERAELQTKIRQLGNRLMNNAQVQEGETPAEDPAFLLKELDDAYAALELLIGRINRTNSETVVKGESLTALLARRDCLAGKNGILRQFSDEASALVSRRTVGEIKIKSTVDVRQLQKQIDALSKELRELDALIQETNWTTELL